MIKQSLHRLNICICCLLVAITALSGCSSSGGNLGSRIDFSTTAPKATSPQIGDGVYLGAIIAEGAQTITDFNTRTSLRHAVFGDFFQFPACVLTGSQQSDRLSRFLAECRTNGAMAMITIELPAGFNSYDNSDVELLAARLKSAQIPIFLRWAHEMNGSWYAWGQQPSAYIQSFRSAATIMSTTADNVAMTWTPNQGWGYPWSGGQFSAVAGTAEFALLDTNKNLTLDEADDPYSPYYPGDDVVDWVGFSFYHWSNRLERGYNEVPSLAKWAESNGINSPVINFHDEFATKRNKPMMIAETAAFFDTADTKMGGANESDIKVNWVKQVYNLKDPSIASLKNELSNIKAIFWFNIEKFEAETNSMVDWRVSHDPETAAFYAERLQDSYFIKADEVIIISE